MNKIVLALLFSTSVYALELEFVGPCDKIPLMKVQVTAGYPNVGELTVATLCDLNIPFKGSSQGLASVFETPTGMAAVEVLSNEEIRAYGWCFSIDGFSPEVYPHEVPITSETKKITWHFGFARFFKGEWITQCTPAYSIKPAFLCPIE